MYRFGYNNTPNYIYNTSAQLGAYHGAEIPYIWQTTSMPLTNNIQPFADFVQKYWLTFAAKFEPNPNDGDGALSWPKYINGSEQNIYLDLIPNVEASMNVRHHCDFWAQYDVNVTTSPTCVPT